MQGLLQLDQASIVVHSLETPSFCYSLFNIEGKLNILVMSLLLAIL